MERILTVVRSDPQLSGLCRRISANTDGWRVLAQAGKVSLAICHTQGGSKIGGGFSTGSTVVAVVRIQSGSAQILHRSLHYEEVPWGTLLESAGIALLFLHSEDDDDFYSRIGSSCLLVIDYEKGKSRTILNYEWGIGATPSFKRVAVEFHIPKSSRLMAVARLIPEERGAIVHMAIVDLGNIVSVCEERIPGVRSIGDIAMDVSSRTVTLVDEDGREYVFTLSNDLKEISVTVIEDSGSGLQIAIYCWRPRLYPSLHAQTKAGNFRRSPPHQHSR